MNIDWFTLDWVKRWGFPLCTLAVGAGAVVGAFQYRGAAQELVNANSVRPPAATVTEVVTTPVPSPQLSVATRTVRETRTETPKPRTVKLDPETEVSTVTATTTATETVTKTPEILHVEFPRGKRDK